MARKRKPSGPTAAEKRRQAARRAKPRRDAQGRWRDAQGHFTTAPKRQKSERKKVTAVRKKVTAVRKVIAPTVELAVAMAQIVPIGANARRELARVAEQMAPGEKVRLLTTKQHRMLIYEAGSWAKYIALASRKAPKGEVNPYWYHLVKETRGGSV